MPRGTPTQVTSSRREFPYRSWHGLPGHEHKTMTMRYPHVSDRETGAATGHLAGGAIRKTVRKPSICATTPSEMTFEMGVVGLVTRAGVVVAAGICCVSATLVDFVP